MTARADLDQATTALSAPQANGQGGDPATTMLPVQRPAQAAASRSGQGATGRIRRLLAPAFALLALALLPAAAATTDLSALDGWGLAKVLGPAAWASLLCAVAACLAELSLRRPRIPMLAAVTGVLILCSVGLPSIVEPAARFGTAWTIAGFVDAVSVQNGVPPVGIDARFYWPAFFAQWAWFRDVGGVTQLDTVLRWFPPVVVAVWATGIYALARSMLGGTHAPWVAAWLFIGLNWIEQDYFSPQALGIVLLLTILTFALGPLATRRTDAAGVPAWPAPHAGARRLPLLRRWLVAAMTPPNRPTLPARQLLLIYFCTALCLLAVIPAHQLTPFAIIGQLALLAVVGRFRGRGIVLVGIIGVIIFLLIVGRDFWTNQLGIITGSGSDGTTGGGALQAGVGNRLAGDAGQVAVKYLRIIVPGLTYLLGIVGAWVYWRRRRDLVPIGLAVVPMAFAAQGYGGEVFLRIVLFGLPILVILGTDALRALVRWRRGMRVVLALGMAVMFGTLVLIRGGNDAYQVVYPEEVAMYRQVIAETPRGQEIVALSQVGPTGMEGVSTHGRGSAIEGCGQLADDPIRCIDLEYPDVIVTYTSIEKEGVYLNGKAPNWSLELIQELVASGRYYITYQNGYNAVLKKASTFAASAEG